MTRRTSEPDCATMTAPMPFPFSSAATFIRASRTDPTVEPTAFGVAGVAWDGAVTNRPGARFGPAAIRQSSLMLCDATHPHFNVSPAAHLQDHGDLALPNTHLSALRAALEPQALALIQRQHMVWLGGDHSITLSLLRAYRAWSGRPLAVIHFDAHCDTWPGHFGEPSGHGTWAHEALHEGLIDPRGFVQLGLRSAGERSARERVRDEGGLIFDGRSLRGLHRAADLQPVVQAVRDRLQALQNPPVYLTLDIDCLDPAFAPGTGTPEPAGMTTDQVMTLLESWVDLPWVGMDCVEVSPPYDHAELTSLAAAHLVWTYLSGRVAHQIDSSPVGVHPSDS